MSPSKEDSVKKHNFSFYLPNLCLKPFEIWNLKRDLQILWKWARFLEKWSWGMQAMDIILTWIYDLHTSITILHNGGEGTCFILLSHLLFSSSAAGPCHLFAGPAEGISYWEELLYIPTKLSLGEGPHQLNMRKVIEKSTHALKPSMHIVKGPTL